MSSLHPPVSIEKTITYIKQKINGWLLCLWMIFNILDGIQDRDFKNLRRILRKVNHKRDRLIRTEIFRIKDKIRGRQKHRDENVLVVR